jgi:hypothetical protein
VNDLLRCLIVLSLVLVTPWAARAAGSQLQADYASLVSRADITLDKPVTRGEEGLPVGNGRMARQDRKSVV